MSMTVKQLANILGVSITAIRKRFTDTFTENILHYKFKIRNWNLCLRK